MKIELLNIEKGKKYAQPQYRIDYMAGEEYKSVLLPAGIPARDQIINEVISERYPVDKMEAVVNNYLLDMTDEESVSEFNQMQEYRQAAKEFADVVLKEIGGV